MIRMNFEEKHISSEYKFKGRVFNARVDKVLLPNGKEATREIVEHNGGVCIVAEDGDDIYLVKQFRYAFGRLIYEVPAGKLEKDEDPREGALRELKEEIGATPESFEFLGRICPSVGYCKEMLYIYLARGLKVTENSPDEDEFLSIEKLPREKIYEMIENGEIDDGKTIAAMFYYERKRQHEKTR